MSRSADAMSGGSFVFPFATVSNESYTIQGEQGSSHFHDFRRFDAAIPACETPVARGLTLTLLVHMHKGCTRGAQGTNTVPIPDHYRASSGYSGHSTAGGYCGVLWEALSIGALEDGNAQRRWKAEGRTQPGLVGTGMGGEGVSPAS